ncbi:peptidyl-prolyl cis-trans isomerase [Thalassotalea litorea]|uniref:peptidylprolyl isomerase n=1 Tax=Thalassotalea litorea TaxID=2020715 RepID=UPI00373508A3
MLKKIITEPLTHFLILAVIIVYFTADDASSNTQEIRVSSGRIEQLSNDFARRNDRPPTQQELDIAVQSYALNQVYLHQARKLGLQQNDRVIDRRLRQKMEYLLDEMATLSSPNDEQLSLFYHQNIERYQTPALLSFEQIFISDDRPQAEFTQVIATQQTRIEQGEIPTGDHSLLPASVNNASLEDISEQFGNYFAQKITQLPLQQWIGPITSSYGKHFVRVHQYQVKAPIPIVKIKRKVTLDWQYQKAQVFKKAYEQTLLQDYEIKVSWPEIYGDGH